MADTVREFFETLESRVDPAKTAGMNDSLPSSTSTAPAPGRSTSTTARSPSPRAAATPTARSRPRRRRSRRSRRRAEPDRRVHDRQAEGQGRHGRGDEAPEALLGATPRARPAARRRRRGRPRATCTARTTRLVRRDDRRLHLHRLEHDERLARLDRVALRDEHADDRAGHRRGERALLAAAGRARARRRRGRAAARAAGAGRLRRKPPRQGPLGSRAAAAPRAAGARSGTPSSSRPARSAGCATSQRRNGRFVTTPVDLGLGERRGEPVERLVARRAVRDQLRDQRVVRVPTSSPSSTPASTRIPVGSRSRSIRPVCGRNVRGSSA